MKKEESIREGGNLFCPLCGRRYKNDDFIDADFWLRESLRFVWYGSSWFCTKCNKQVVIGEKYLGELSEFEVDLKEKKAVFIIHLKGEKEPLEGFLKVHDYSIKEKGGKLILIVRKVSLVAREWMAIALEKYWPGEIMFEILDNEYIVKALKTAGMLN